MLKHHSSFFTFTSILERAHGTLYDLMQGPMWSLPVVLLLGHSLDHMKPYFKGYGGGGLKDDSVWHDGKRSYSPQHLLELLALSDAAIRANGGIPDTVHQSLQNDPHFHSMHPQVQAALVIIYWLADTGRRTSFWNGRTTPLLPGPTSCTCPKRFHTKKNGHSPVRRTTMTSKQVEAGENTNG